MRYAVLYASSTGNTREVAQAIFHALPRGEARLAPIIPGSAPPEEETVFLGFWADKGSCPGSVQELLSQLCGKRLALFGTAGFGGSAAYFDAITQRVEALVPAGNEVLGAWMCQGRMPAAVRARYEAMLREHPEDAKLKNFVENFDRARAHPDSADLSAAGDFARRIADGGRKTFQRF